VLSDNCSGRSLLAGNAAVVLADMSAWNPPKLHPLLTEASSRPFMHCDRPVSAGGVRLKETNINLLINLHFFDIFY
jgi:hypothetical protein